VFKKTVSLGFLIAGMVIMNCCASRPDQSVADVAAIHERIFTLDTHADTPLRILGDGIDPGRDNSDRKAISKIDFPRMRAGGLDAIFFAIFIGQGSLDSAGYHRARTLLWRTLDTVDSVLAANIDQATPAYASSDALRIVATGKRAVFRGLENGYPIARDLDMLSRLYDRGVRYVTLTHMKNNDICDSSTDSSVYGGLSAFGEKVVVEMNRLGMMVDVSHASDETVWDVLKLSRAPIIASHSNSRAVRDVARNLPDTLLSAIAARGGVIQTNILSYYVKATGSYAERDSAKAELKRKWAPREPLNAEQQDAKWAEEDLLDEKYPPILATVSDFVDHLDHMVQVAGIDHVGIGTDFDGGGGLADCFDVSELPSITRELVRRGYTEDDLAKLWGMNLLRVMAAVEKARTANAGT